MKTIDKVSVLKMIAIAVAITLMVTITMVVKATMMMEDTTVMVKATKARTISLDKNGTTGCKSKSRDPQVLAVKELTDHGSFEAEREGFEPSVGFHQHRFSRPAQSATLSPLRRYIIVL